MVVAVEYGAEWRFIPRPEAGVDLVMVVQVVGEEPLAFARRFLSRIVSLLDRGADVVSAALGVCSVFDLRHLEARCVMVRAILRTFRAGAKSQLHLVAPIDATLDCRRHLSAIAEALQEGAAADSQIRISCDLGEQSNATTASTRRYPSYSTVTARERS